MSLCVALQWQFFIEASNTAQLDVAISFIADHQQNFKNSGNDKGNDCLKGAKSVGTCAGSAVNFYWKSGVPGSVKGN